MSRNPFAAPVIAPGVSPYRLPVSETWERLLTRFEQRACRGAVVGPHGCGKSTFVCSFLEQAIECGLVASRTCQIVQFQAPRTFYRLAADFQDQGFRRRGLHRQEVIEFSAMLASRQPSGLLVIDGFDGIPCWQRWRIHRAIRRSTGGLLVTSHRPLSRLETLYDCSASWDAFCDEAYRRWGSDGRLDADRLAAIWARHPGNIREGLFALYDDWEVRQSDRDSAVRGADDSDATRTT